jgi:hypothetical protein
MPKLKLDESKRQIIEEFKKLGIFFRNKDIRMLQNQGFLPLRYGNRKVACSIANLQKFVNEGVYPPEIFQVVKRNRCYLYTEHYCEALIFGANFNAEVLVNEKELWLNGGNAISIRDEMLTCISILARLVQCIFSYFKNKMTTYFQYQMPTLPRYGLLKNIKNYKVIML